MNRATLCRGTAAAIASLALLPGTLFAGEWRIVPRLEVREAFTDNVFLTRRNRRSDLVTTVSPGINISGQGARLRLDLDYAPSYDAYLREGSLNGFRHDLRASGNAELLKDNLFLDVSAFTGQSPAQSSSQESAIDRRQIAGQTQFSSYSISPYWRTRLGNWASGEARYRFSQVFSRVNSATALGTGNALSDTNVHQGSAFIESGENFNRFRWRSTAQFTDTEASGDASTAVQSRPYKSYTVDFQPSYVVTRWLQLIGTIGYERIQSSNITNDIDGPFWNVGFRLTPSERTNFELTYGDRYNGRNWGSSFTTARPDGTTLTFSYRESVETEALQAVNNLGFLVRDPNGVLIDRRTGLPFVGRNPNFDQSDQAFLSRSFFLSLVIPRERNTYVLSLERTTRDYEIADATAPSGRNEVTIGGRATWDHKLTPEISSTALLSYSDIKTDLGTGGAQGTNQTLRGQVSLNYDLNETLRATLGYAYIRRDISGQQFFPNQFTRAYRENVVFVTLRKSF